MTNATTTAEQAAGRAAGFIWFVTIVTGWAAFWVLALGTDDAVADLWRAIRDLPLLVEGLAWIAFFPYVLALGIWSTDWQASIRAVLVLVCTAAWSLAFWPWQRG